MTYPSLAFVAQQSMPPDNVLRTAVVLSVDPAAGAAVVQVGGQVIPDLRYLDGGDPPIPGDTVAVLRQDATWLILGRISAPYPRRSGIVGSGRSLDTTTISSTTIGVEQAVTTWEREPGFMARPGRFYRLAWQGRTYVSGGTIALVFGHVRIREGSLSTLGTQLGVWVIETQSNFVAYSVGGWCLVRYDGPEERPCALSVTISKAAGTGTTINLVGDTLSRIDVTIEDVTGSVAADSAGLDDLATGFQIF